MPAATTIPLAAGFLPDDWKRLCAELDVPAFRAAQLWQWVACRLVADWEQMTNLPAALRRTLAGRCDLSALTVCERTASPDGVTKFLLACRDGERIESVLIPSRDRQTLCVSTQAGCAFRCAFCASGALGLARDLDAGEIVGQVFAAARELRATPNAAPDARPENVVFMGMGEPLANYDNTLRAIRVLNAPGGLTIGARRMTLSTCGVVPGIRRLADEGLQVELSVSLHAPDDRLRQSLLPVAARWPIAELLAACADYTARTGRIITFEYTLVRGLNDQPRHAELLARLLRPLHCRVNLIPLSPVAAFDGHPPDAETCARFQAVLEQARINTTLRHSRGRQADAACGQLRLRRTGGRQVAPHNPKHST
ncbi:MAG: 23S rRNA (adenine(2503)-C(2))-methyltransferase RlmN [Lentisphaerae bacterium]|nr:23S rRNA (adenine(2503)-C(2))-methyltransferase RlmN [Lentisphaerota bacterium]